MSAHALHEPNVGTLGDKTADAGVSQIVPSVAAAFELRLLERPLPDAVAPVRAIVPRPNVTVDDVRELSQALVHIDEEHLARTLARVFNELEHRELEWAVTRWVSGGE